MTRSEFLELIDKTKEGMARTGLKELADDALYLAPRRGEADQPDRLMDPKEHLIALLQTFDRHLAVEDVNLVHRSLKKINDRLIEPKLEMVRVGGYRRDGEVVGEAEEFDLRKLPDWSELRARLGRLIEELKNERETDPS